jgi:hypothetical protein
MGLPVPSLLPKEGFEERPQVGSSSFYSIVVGQNMVGGTITILSAERVKGCMCLDIADQPSLVPAREHGACWMDPGRLGKWDYYQGTQYPGTVFESANG